MPGADLAPALESDREPVVAAADHLVATGVEDADVTGSVVPLGDVPREVQVLHRVVLGADGQVLLTLDPGQTSGHGPGDQDGRGAIEHLETNVVM